MYELIPQRNPKTVQRLILLLFVGAVAIMGITSVFPELPFRWIFQTVGIILLTMGIFMMRYLTRVYIYRILTEGEGKADFCVIEANAKGKRQVTVCRIGLSNIKERILLDETEGEEAKRQRDEARKGKKYFDYCVNFRPRKSFLIIAEEGGEEFVLRLEYEQTLYELLVPVEKPE